MTPEQRETIVELLRSGKDLDPEWERILFPPGKREYELVYAGKEREEEILADTMAVPLQPVRTFGKNGKGWHNKLIFGDNLQAMRTLLEMKERGELVNSDGTHGVRLIYIDPPFATKREFLGNDEQKAYQDKISGAEFIEFLRKRIVLMHRLLSSDGSIYVHLDTKKVHYIKVLMDEIFGEHNFRNEIIWKRQSAHNDTKQGSAHYGRLHDTVLFYTRGKQFVWNPQYEAYDEEYVDTFYKHEDENGKYRLSDLTAAKPGGDTLYEWRVKRQLPDGKWEADLEDEHKKPKKTWEYKGTLPYKGRSWAYSKANLIEYAKAGRLAYTRDGRPQYIRYQDEMKGRLLQDVWTNVTMGSGANERTGYPTQKGEALVHPLILSSSKPGDIVLDAFAGAGTAAAVAEKTDRRWIALDCGKLSIYTIQRRMLNLRAEIGNKGRQLNAKPFTLYNAGLYDFSTLRELPWEDWRFFALNLFQCKDEKHRIGGIDLDGYFKGGDVLVFNHFEADGAKVTYETIDDIHQALGKKIGRKFFIIAPALSFGFQEDYTDRDKTRYYALRIPYSIIAELHRRDFTAIRQPVDEAEVNDTVESVGFDFIRTPEAKVSYSVGQQKGGLFTMLKVKIHTFKSVLVGRGKVLEDFESLSMLMVDTAYDGDVFDLDHYELADKIKADNYVVELPVDDDMGERIMVVLVDIHGNEYREVKTREELGLGTKEKPEEPAQRRRKT